MKTGFRKVFMTWKSYRNEIRYPIINFVGNKEEIK